MILRLSLLTAALALSGCVHNATDSALEVGSNQVQIRQIQSRAFDTTDKTKTLRTVISTTCFLTARTSASAFTPDSAAAPPRLSIYSPPSAGTASARSNCFHQTPCRNLPTPSKPRPSTTRMSSASSRPQFQTPLPLATHLQTFAFPSPARRRKQPSSGTVSAGIAPWVLRLRRIS